MTNTTTLLQNAVSGPSTTAAKSSSAAMPQPVPLERNYQYVPVGPGSRGLGQLGQSSNLNTDHHPRTSQQLSSTNTNYAINSLSTMSTKPTGILKGGTGPGPVVNAPSSGSAAGNNNYVDPGLESSPGTPEKPTYAFDYN